ncbi:VAMP5 protein, partial [Pomatostomus ruficeps]|nr:VAMP5 protein [Pomatostomus ruficeps]
SGTRDPPGSACPGAGAGAGPGARAPGGGGRWPARVFPCPCVPACPDPACRACPRGAGVPAIPNVPVSLTVPMVPLSPCPFVPMVPLCHSARVPSVPTASPPCPHTVPPCPQAGLARCQREAEEVTELMRQNVARALEREGHLEQLQSRAQDLRQASEAFTRTTQTVTRRQRRGRRRWHLMALGLGLLLLFILGLALALALARSSPGTVTSTVPTPREGTKRPPSTAGIL